MTSDLKQNIYKEYDPQFTADISKKMQMPDRLIPGGGFHEINNQIDSPFYKSGDTLKYGLPVAKLPFEESHYVLTTPPSKLTNFGSTTLADEDNSDHELEIVRRSLWENIPKSNKTHSRMNSINKAQDYLASDENDYDNGEASLPMTPGTMLLIQKGDKLAALQRQVGKLSYRVLKLQDENRRRKAFEWILYPLVIGYLFIQIGKFVFSKPY